MRPAELAGRIAAPALRNELARVLADRGVAITGSELSITYVRYKPDSGCTLGIGGPAHGPLGYVKLFFNDDPEVCYRKYRDREKGAGWVARLPDLRALLFRFPMDREVVGLPSIVEASRLKHVLHECVDSLSPDAERIRAKKSGVEILRYKPERRCLVDARLATKDTSDRRGERRVVVQAYADDSGARVFDLMRRLRTWSRDRESCLRVPRPMGYHSQRQVLVQEWCSGRPWGEDLRSDDSERWSGLAGRMLRDLWRVPATGRTVRGLEVVTAEASRVLDDLTRLEDSRSGAAAGSLRADLASRCAEVPPQPATVIHGDFHYHQLLVGHGGGVLVDWDEAAIGDPRIDVGNFLAHMHLLEIEGRVPPAHAAALSSAFLEGVAGAGPALNDLDVFVAVHLTKLALVPFRNLRADWRDSTTRLLDRAGAILDTATEALP